MTRPTTPRVATALRRPQIVAAALRMLARTPIESLTTRALAAELGLTQPALFRHFPDREALLLAVVEHARGELEQRAVAIVEGDRPALAQLEALGEALLVYAEREPGLPRLLFSSATGEGRVREALRQTVGLQASLVAELVRRAQRDGALDAGLEADVAATLFVGMLQGLILRWELGARAEPLAAKLGPMFALWLDGARARGTPSVAAQAAPSPAAAAAGTPSLVLIDAVPILAGGVDPWAAISAALAGLPPTGLLLVVAPFKPAPLLAVLAKRGYAVAAEAGSDGRWRVEITPGGAPRVEDLRDLEPPEPLERVLGASHALPPGGVYLARVPRYPRLLLPHLRQRGLRFDVLERGDGAALLRVERPA